MLTDTQCRAARPCEKAFELAVGCRFTLVSFIQVSVSARTDRLSKSGTRGFGRVVTTDAALSDNSYRWRSVGPLRGCRSLPIGSAAGAGVDAFSCLAAAGSRETCRLGVP